MGLGATAGIMKAKEQAKALLADSKLQRARLEHIRERQSEAFSKNNASVDRTEMDNALAIEKARLVANSELSSATAGSGISGVSVDELSVEVAVDAAEAHNDNVRGADETKDSLFTQRLNTLEDLQFDIDGMPQFDADSAVTGAILSGAAQGAGSLEDVGVARGADDAFTPSGKHKSTQKRPTKGASDGK
jgi:hypothetical protein